MEGPGRSRSIAPQFVMGVLIIVVGVLFTLENLGFIEAASYLRFWPVALIAVGLMKLWSGGRGGPLHGLLFFFAGVWLLLESMSIVTISLWALWPVLLGLPLRMPAKFLHPSRQAACAARPDTQRY